MKICIQAGHVGISTGATGAPGEQKWNAKIVPMVAEKLVQAGQEVYVTDALANKDPKVTSTDWDLFLAVHYDADIYNDRGGFADYPDKDIDQVYERSKELSDKIEEVFFTKTKIPVKNNRSNANTKRYYMWSALTANTPCVLIECGVGYRKPEDYTTLRNYDLVTTSLADAILQALGLQDEKDLKIEKLEKELDEMRASRNDWRTRYKQLEKEYEKEVQELRIHRDLLQKDLSEANARIEVLEKAIMTNKTPLSAYSIKERFQSIVHSLLNGGDFNA